MTKELKVTFAPGCFDSFDGTQEELDETKQALRNNENQDEVADGIGDMLVTIIILAELANLDAVECLRLAYGEIKERKGEMRDGLFVKEEMQVNAMY